MTVYLRPMFGLDKYQYTADKTFMVYSFLSNGPCGPIQKIATFTSIGENIYNFGFGDYDTQSNNISDTAVSNNKDVDIIMGTVGSIIYDFTNIFPKALIFIQGSTPARTRLYQVNLNKHCERIDPLYEIWGLLKKEWVPFQKGINYEAFIGYRKDIL